jgi:hypothetical protein
MTNGDSYASRPLRWVRRYSVAGLILGLLLMAGSAEAQQVHSTGYQLFHNDTEAAGVVLLLPALITVPTFGIIDLVGATRPSPLSVWYGHLELWLGGLPTTASAILLMAAGHEWRTPGAFAILFVGGALSGHALYTIFRTRDSIQSPVQVGLTMDGHGSRGVALCWRY